MQFLSRCGILVALVTAMLVAWGSGGPAPAAAQTAAGPSLEAPSALLLDIRSGDVLYEKDADARMGPASLAKLMTMYLVFEAIADGHLALDQEVTIGVEAWAQAVGGSLMFLDVDDVVTIEELLYGVGVVSGNDASVALAMAVAGSEEVFVQRMNLAAGAFGMENTRFANSHGLPTPGVDHYTTTRDVAIMGARLLRDFPESIEYMIQRQFTYGGVGPQFNRNGLILQDDRVTGLKTGHTDETGYHLAASAWDQEREMHLVAVVMGIRHENEAAAYRLRENEAAHLYDFGFANFQTVEVAWQEAGDEVRVWKGRQNWLPVAPRHEPVVTMARAAEAQDVQVRLELDGRLEAPVARGDRVGELVLTLPGDEGERRVALLAGEEVARGNIFKVFWDSIRLFFAGLR